MHPDLPVIFSTGHGDRWKIDALKSRPDVAFLLKPYDTAALMTTMREVVEKVSRPPSLPAS